MVNFWLDDFSSIIDFDNFKYQNDECDNNVKILNLISLLVVILCLSITIKTKKSFYFGLCIIILSIIIIYYYNNIKDNMNKSKSTFISSSGPSGPSGPSAPFGPSGPSSTSAPFGPSGQSGPSGNYIKTTDEIVKEEVSKVPLYKNGIELLENVVDSNKNGEFTKLLVNSTVNIYSGDIIKIQDKFTETINEINIVSNAYISGSDNIILLRNQLRYNYIKKQTIINVIKSTKAQILSQPNPELSIQNSNNTGSDIDSILKSKEPTDFNRKDYNYSPYNSKYQLQGPPYGDLRCRESSLNNPMGVININEFNEKPTMFGTCNSNLDRDKMTSNYESGISKRINDILYHHSNSQNMFSPMAVDTIPNQQDAFAYFCYQSPTNLINPKYLSVFTHEPEKFKMLAQLANATGTENGGGGGGWGSGTNGRAG